MNIFDDGTATDVSCHGFDGTVVGAVQGEGVSGSALVFDGSDGNYVITPDLGGHDELTVACWFKMTGRVGGWRTLYNVDGWSPGWLHHQLYPNNALGFSINSNPGGNDRLGTTIFDDSSLDRWHHVATVYSSIDQTVKFYVDGVLDTEHAWGGNPVLLDPGRIGGWSGGGRGFQGSIDEMVFLDFAATAGEVVELMNSRLGGGPPLQVTDIALVKDGNSYEVVLNFTSRAGATYAVDRTEDPEGGWNELTNSIGGQEDTTEYRDTLGAGPLPGKMFYRVRELAP